MLTDMFCCNLCNFVMCVPILMLAIHQSVDAWEYAQRYFLGCRWYRSVWLPVSEEWSERRPSAGVHACKSPQQIVQGGDRYASCLSAETLNPIPATVITHQVLPGDTLCGLILPNCRRSDRLERNSGFLPCQHASTAEAILAWVSHARPPRRGHDFSFTRPDICSACA